MPQLDQLIQTELADIVYKSIPLGLVPKYGL